MVNISIFEDILTHAADLIVSETEHFYLIQDKDPIVDNHHTIISKGHYDCMGELPVFVFNEIEMLKSHLKQFFNFKPFIGYECGSGTYFQLHYMPVEIDITDSLARRFEKMKIDSLEWMPKYHQWFGEYLYFEDTARQGYFYSTNGKAEPHLLRRLVCEGLENGKLH